MAEYTVSVPLKISDFFPKKLKQQYFIAQMLSKEILNKCERGTTHQNVNRVKKYVVNI